MLIYPSSFNELKTQSRKRKSLPFFEQKETPVKRQLFKDEKEIENKSLTMENKK